MNFAKRFGGHRTPRALRLILLAALAAASTLAHAPGVRAQEQQPVEEMRKLREEVRSLREGMSEVQRELQEIKKLLLSRQPAAANEPPREVFMDLSGAPSKGSDGAKLVLIEYSDYQCPFCSRYVRDTLPLIERDYVQTGKVRYVFRDFPLESIHPDALRASEAAACAGEQGKYWEMHDRLFANQNALAAANMPAHAQAVGVNQEAFQQCLASGKHREPIRKVMAEAAGLGVSGTPTFFVGVVTPNDPKVKIVRALRGAQPYPKFKEILDGVLASPQ